MIKVLEIIGKGFVYIIVPLLVIGFLANGQLLVAIFLAIIFFGVLIVTKK